MYYFLIPIDWKEKLLYLRFLLFKFLSLSHHPVYLASLIRINFMYLVKLEKKKKEKKVHYSKEQTYFIYIARRSSTYSLNQSKTKPENLEEK